MSRRKYIIDITVNELAIRNLVVDPHYEEKHSKSMNDALIIELVKTLDHEAHVPVAIDGVYSYFVKDPIEYHGKAYRLIWLLEERENYIGVVNAYRR